MLGTLMLRTITEPGINVEEGMVTFLPESKELLEQLVASGDLFKLQMPIGGKPYLFGVVEDLDEFNKNEYNKLSQIWVVDFEGGFLPVDTDDALLLPAKKAVPGDKVEFKEWQPSEGQKKVAKLSVRK